MTDIGLTHVALPVRSLSASVAFYLKYAGMQTVHQRPGVVWVSDRTRPFALVLIETANEIKPLLPMAHLGVGVRSRDEVERAHTERMTMSDLCAHLFKDYQFGLSLVKKNTGRSKFVLGAEAVEGPDRCLSELVVQSYYPGSASTTKP